MEKLSGLPPVGGGIKVELMSARLKNDPNDAEAYHLRGHALEQIQHYHDASDDFTAAIRLRPDDAHLRFDQGENDQLLKRSEPAMTDLEAALERHRDHPAIREMLAWCSNNMAWNLANGPKSTRDPERALHPFRRAVELNKHKSYYLSALGVVEYRAGHYTKAVATMGRSLAAGHGRDDATDLFFMAMAHYQLGDREKARDCYDRAVRWLAGQKSLSAEEAMDVAAFRTEAEAVLAVPTGELPANVIAPPR